MAPNYPLTLEKTRFGSCYYGEQGGSVLQQDYGKLEISSQISPGTWSNWTTLNTFSKASGSWTNGFADLSGYAGKKVRIGYFLDNGGIDCYSGPSVSSGWYIDEVLIEVN